MRIIDISSREAFAVMVSFLSESVRARFKYLIGMLHCFCAHALLVSCLDIHRHSRGIRIYLFSRVEVRSEGIQGASSVL